MNTKQTPLYAFHHAHNARMVSFAGWDMPVQYATGIKAEHLATRKSAGLFGVSHMAQLEISGDQAAADHDIAYLEKHLGAKTKLTHRTDRALVAIQGPKSVDVLGMLGLHLDDFRFMQLRHFDFYGTDLLISRSGYTGEDGFEIAIPVGAATALCDACLSTGLVTLAGFGARDTERVKVGLPLWGRELDETITPVEAGLGFVEEEFAAAGTPLLADTLGTPTAITVSSLPFVQHQYFR